MISEFTVHVLDEVDWMTYRDMRLTALKESPEAFAATHALEEAYEETLWRERMRRATRLVALDDNAPVGILSIGPTQADFDDAAELFGLWVRPELRGAGVAKDLFNAASREAGRSGAEQLVYWVGTDNGRAVAFASGRGFRPSEQRRPMGGGHNGEEEVAMILSLGSR